jgi:hypothetical protein
MASRSPAGVWVIAQISSATAAVSSLVGKALGTAGVVGYGPRIPANMLFNADQTMNLGVIQRHYDYAHARGKWFKPRVIWGKYTPAWAMGPRIAGFAGPAPYLAGGAPNVAFEAAQELLALAIAAWAAPKPDVREYDCGHCSLEYSELYNGKEIQTLYGASPTVARERFIVAHRRLMAINHEACSPVGLPVGFGLSGHGPITEISGALAAYATTKPLGSIYVQANGFGPDGEWGGAGELGQDMQVWDKIEGTCGAGLQDISAKAPRTVAQVAKMFDNVLKLQAQGVLVVYIEQYFYQWDSGTGNFHDTPAAYAEFIRQIGLFEPSLLDDDSDGDGLEQLQAELAELQAQVPPLEAEVSADGAAVGNAQAALVQAQAEATDSAARLVALQADIARVQALIDALG